MWRLIIKNNKSKLSINESIVASEVRLVLADGTQRGIVSLQEALNIANEEGLDLVEITTNAKPPVCKIMNYKKYLFNEKKKRSASKKKQKQIQVKEIKFRPNTDIGDYSFKLKNLRKFLEEGNKVKVTIRFRGREMAHHELGMNLIKRVENDLADLAKIEIEPKMLGKQISVTFTRLTK